MNFSPVIFRSCITSIRRKAYKDKRFALNNEES